MVPSNFTDLMLMLGALQAILEKLSYLTLALGVASRFLFNAFSKPSAKNDVEEDSEPKTYEHKKKVHKKAKNIQDTSNDSAAFEEKLNELNVILTKVVWLSGTMKRDNDKTM